MASPKMLCTHNTCKKIRQEHTCISGVGILLVHKHWKKNQCNVVVDGINERGGQYRDQTNVVGGSLNKGETCYLEAILREYLEEYSPMVAEQLLRGEITCEHLTLSNYYEVAMSILGSDFKQEIKYFYFGHTVIFIGRLPDDISRRNTNDLIRRKNALNIKWCLKEANFIDSIVVSSQLSIDSVILPGGGHSNVSTSSYLAAVLRIINDPNSQAYAEFMTVLNRNLPDQTLV